MLRRSGVTKGGAYLSYKPSFDSATKTVMWPEDNEFALFPSAVAKGLMDRGYAKPITKEEVDAYNEQLGDEPVVVDEEDSEDEDSQETADEEDSEGDELEEKPAESSRSRRNRKKGAK